VSEDQSARGDPVELLYPFYLDTDMSMAFSAVLAGGVTLEEEHVGRSDEASQAIRSLRGNLRLWRAGGFDAGRERTEKTELTNESRLVRRHTVASIFIDLYEELRTTGRLIESPDVKDLAIGDIVSMRMGPAVAPLRRVLNQVIRLLNVMAPMLPDETEDAHDADPQMNRQQRRARAREGAKRPDAEDDEGLRALKQLRRLFIALRDDLDHSGMIDIAVTSDTSLNAVLTLDKRFVAPPTEELLHTSGFTVVGKVTQVWRDTEDIVNLYRRSVVSLLPSLAQSTAWGVFTLLGSVASNLDVRGMERAAYEAVGATFEADEPPDAVSTAETHSEEAPQEDAEGERALVEPDEASPEEDDEIMFGDDISALTPIVTGPAVQILPLAICS
jgi:hypothetical protein